MAMGRPRKEIDQKSFEKLCEMQCTKEEICGYFECSPKTLDAWCKRTYKATFSLVFSQKRSGGKISLRRAQFQSALSGNSRMLIWLGRQYLGQTERPPDAIDTEDADSYFDEAGLK